MKVENKILTFFALYFIIFIDLGTVEKIKANCKDTVPIPTSDMPRFGNIIMSIQFNAPSLVNKSIDKPLRHSVLTTFDVLLPAIASTSVPIIVNNALWDIFAIKRNQFHINKDSSQTTEKYYLLNSLYETYKEFLISNSSLIIEILNNDPLALSALKKYSSHHSKYWTIFSYNLDQRLEPIKEMIKNYIRLQTNIQQEQAKSLDKQFDPKEFKKNMKDSFCIETLCHEVPFDSDNWTIYENDVFHILIPHSYAEQRGAFYRTIDGQNILRPYYLGLKMKGMTKVDITDSYNLPTSKRVTTDITDTVLINAIDQIFYTTDEMAQLPSWNFFIDGHGYHLSKSKVVQIDKIVQLLKKTMQEFGVLRNFETLEKLNAACEDKDNNKCGLIRSLYQYATEYKKLLKNSVASVTGLSLIKWRSLLNYFENKIHTDLVVYNACYGGEKLALDIFNILGTSHKHKFKLVSLTTSRYLANTTDALIDLLRSNYKPIQFSRYKTGDKFLPELNTYLKVSDNHIVLDLNNQIDFKSFFNLLNAQTLGIKPGYEFSKILSCLQKKGGSQLPSMRTLSATDEPEARLIQGSYKAYTITKVMTRTSRLFRINHSKQLIIYTNYVPQPILIEQQKLPRLILETNEHPILFEIINAPNNTLLEIALSMTKPLATRRQVSSIIGIANLLALNQNNNSDERNIINFDKVLIDNTNTITPDKDGYIYSTVLYTYNQQIYGFIIKGKKHDEDFNFVLSEALDMQSQDSQAILKQYNSHWHELEAIRTSLSSHFFVTRVPREQSKL